jgi:[acyl-carrier-protein] S-malonyltransferase
MQNSGVHAFLEIGPSKTLSGMNKKIEVPAPTLSVEKVADLDKLVHQWEFLCSS